MTGDVTAIWAAASMRLKQVLNEDTFQRWIAGIRPLGLQDGVCRLGVSNDMFCDWLATNYLDVIQEALALAAGGPVTASFESGYDPEVVGAAESASAGTAGGATAAATRAGIEERDELLSRFNRHYTFDSFVVGENNKFAHAACGAVAKTPGKAYNPLFIYGGTGLGKTHLLQAVAQDVVGRRKRARIEYLTSEEFLNRFIDALREKSLPRFRQIFRNVDVLLIDDVHFFTGKEQIQEEFFHTFNALYNSHKQIIITSDRPPHEIGGLEKRLVSRFEWGLTTEVQSPDLETRVAILRCKQEDQAVKIDDDVLFCIASRIKSNIRRLEGALIRLISHASLNHTPVTRELAEKLLQPMLDEEATGSVSIERIQKVVAEFYDVRLADMTSKARPANIAFPRQVAMYLARRLTDCSTPVIGEQFRRNHATVLHAVTTVSARQERDAEFRQSLAVLERKVRN
ncbi:MAG: chromosomal replication initiator protein DnaA [Lentisphaeria bacterium]